MARTDPEDLKLADTVHVHYENPHEKTTRSDLEWQFKLAFNECGVEPDELTDDYVTGTLIPRLVEQVPIAAFEPIEPWQKGYLFFQGDITTPKMQELCSEIMQVHLNAPLATPITLFFSTDGGEIEAGFALMGTIQAMQRQGRRVHIHVSGSAYSMGSLILQVADHRSMSSWSFLMLHELSSELKGKLSDQSDNVKQNKILDLTCNLIYSGRSGQPLGLFETKCFRKDWYLGAKEALAKNLVDEIIDPPHFKLAEKPKTVKKRTKKVKDDATGTTGAIAAGTGSAPATDTNQG